MAQTLPYQALKDAPKEIRQAATVALIASSISSALGILFGTIILATLPTWVPGLLAYQPVPIALLVFAMGSGIVAKKGLRIRERIGGREFEKARGATFSTAILGFIVAGGVPGILYLFLYMRIGTVMMKARPDDPKTVYLMPHPSEGIFLGRYIGWAAAYLLVLYIGYTQLPAGLRGISDWLSPVLGVHFNTLVVAVYLIFTNPLTYPPILQLWIIAGLLGGIIAGGRVGRGFMVGLAVFLSTLGAMGLAALSIFRTFTSGNLPGIPAPPAGFPLVSAATGPVASDLLPLFFQASSPTSPAFLESVALTMARNSGLIFAIVTISGRAASLAWQGGIDLAKFVFVLIRKKPKLQAAPTITDRPVLKTALILLMLLPLLAFPHYGSHSQSIHAPPSGPYEQRLDVSLSMIGAPNSSLEMTNLDLSSHGITFDNNYANANIAAFIVNNNDSQALGGGQGQQAGQFLQIISQPALVTFYQAGSSAAQSNAIESQFSQALGVPFTTIFSLPAGGGSATIYAPNPELSNYDALTRLLGLLPSQSFSTLITPSNIQNLKYFAALGVVPLTVNGTRVSGLSFYLNIEWPRQYFKGGTHQFDLKSLLGFPNNIVGDPAANASIITIDFQPGTILYSPLFPNPFYYNSTSTYILNVSGGSSPDFTAQFAYPFAPDIVIRKVATPTSGPIGTTHTIVVTVQNLDNVTITNLVATDPETTSDYAQTLQAAPAGTQTLQSPLLAAGNSLTMTYSVTTTSSGIYVLSPSTVNFAWDAPNGTKLTYSIATDQLQLNSFMGPLDQFSRTFTDFQPYSYLLLVPLLLTPVIETYKLMRRRAKRRKEKELLARSSPSLVPHPNNAPAGPTNGSQNPSPPN